MSLWEIEPLTTYPMYSSPFPMRLKRPWPTGLPSLYGTSDDCIFSQYLQMISVNNQRFILYRFILIMVKVILLVMVFAGGKEDDLTSSLMWLRDGANPGFQSFNFGGLGMSPWMQPRMDSSLLGLQPDMYQAISAAAFQNTAKQVSPALLQFQQPQNIAGRSALLSSQILQQVQPQFQEMHHQNINDSAIQGHNQSEYLQQQLQRCQSFNGQKSPPPPQQQQESHQQHQQQQSQCMQTPQHQQMQEQKHSPDFQSVPNALSVFSQLSSTTQSPPSILPTVSAFSQQQNFQDRSINSLSPSNVPSMHDTLRPFPSETGSKLQGVPRTTPVPVSDPWSSKRVAMESVIPSGSHVNSSHIQQLDSAPSNIPQSSSLAPLPGRECLVDQDGSSDHQNHLLFGVNIDSQSLLMQGGIPSLQEDNGCIASLQDDNDSSTIPYSTCNFLSPSQNDFPLNEALASSGCLDESGYVSFSENSDHVNQPTAAFVKVTELTYPPNRTNNISIFFSMKAL